MKFAPSPPTFATTAVVQLVGTGAVDEREAVVGGAVDANVIRRTSGRRWPRIVIPPGVHDRKPENSLLLASTMESPDEPMKTGRLPFPPRAATECSRSGTRM